MKKVPPPLPEGVKKPEINPVVEQLLLDKLEVLEKELAAVKGCRTKEPKEKDSKTAPASKPDEDDGENASDSENDDDSDDDDDDKQHIVTPDGVTAPRLQSNSFCLDLLMCHFVGFTDLLVHLFGCTNLHEELGNIFSFTSIHTCFWMFLFLHVLKGPTLSSYIYIYICIYSYSRSPLYLLHIPRSLRYIYIIHMCICAFPFRFPSQQQLSA